MSPAPAPAEILRPYSSLDAGRFKISGMANWDPVPFVDSDPDLCIACLEPDVLLYGGEPPPSEVPSRARESERELLALAHKWDEKRLLKENYSDQVSPEDAVRVFNCYKDRLCDRQIGKRRACNFERALRGPSTTLPCGPGLDPSCQTLHIAITDKKDFYHQLLSRPRKAAHNSVFRP